MQRHEYDALKMRVQQGLMSFEAALDHLYERLEAAVAGPVEVAVPQVLSAVVDSSATGSSTLDPNKAPDTGAEGNL